MSPPAQAQETAGQINGLITTATGAPAPGVQVTIKHLPSGTTATATTNVDGRFISRGLRLGGPYEVVLNAGGSAETVADEVFITLGSPYELDYPLGGRKAAAIEEVVVSGNAMKTEMVGPSTQFDREHINTAPVTSVNRDLKDIIRFDPKVKIDRFNSDAIQITGSNNRFNLLTVDGVRQNDDFGLNNGGYPSARTPLSLDVIDQLSVNSAPFAVTYSGFQGGNVNVVTKSGTNDWHGSGYFYYSDDSLIGSKSGQRAITGLSFTDKTYGGTLGGPIVQDKLFFFAGYEKFETGAPVSRGPSGGGFANEVSSISKADFDQVISIAQSTYGYDAGTLPKNLPETDEKWFIKGDWNISDQHKLVASYNHDKGSLIVQTGPSTLASAPASLSASSDWYANIQSVDSVSTQLFSDWTDQLKTELKYGYKYQTGRPTPLGKTPFPEMQIVTSNGGILSIGPDRFRHFNALTNELHTIKAKGDYLAGDHTLTAGYEREMLNVFNAFLQDSYGTFLFSSIADFQNRRAAQLVYQNAVSGNVNDSAASFSTNTDALYVQDAWHITPDLTVIAGVRYEMYSSNDKPVANANFLSRYGFSNTQTLDGRDLILPRFSFNYKFDKDTVVRGGAGLFGGGSPTVWLSNSFSNAGVVTSNTTISRATSNPTLVAGALDGVTGTIPALVRQQLAAGDGSVNAIDPNFSIPSIWKFNFGVDHNFDLGFLGDDYFVSTDIIYGRVNKAVLWKENRVVQTGTAPDGRPIYSRRPGVPSSGNDLILTNTTKGDTFTMSVQAAKAWKGNSWGDFEVQVGYAYNRARDVNPATSSTAQSNWDNLATSDINNPTLATSNYELRHNGTIALSWSKALLMDNYKTTISMFGNAYSGHPYSYTFAGASSIFGDPRQASRQRQLFYVPIDQNDVILAGGLTWDQLNAFIMKNGLDKYRGKIAPRNAFTSPPVGTVDMHFEQEIPGFFDGAKGRFIMNISNLTNLINNNWGRITQYDFPYVVPVVQATGISGGKYIYSGPIQRTDKRLAARQSVWGINFGVRYEF